jgi:hypothetical protein
MYFHTAATKQGRDKMPLTGKKEFDPVFEGSHRYLTAGRDVLPTDYDIHGPVKGQDPDDIGGDNLKRHKTSIG